MVVTLDPLIEITLPLPPLQAAYTIPVDASWWTLKALIHCETVAIVVTIEPLIEITPPLYTPLLYAPHAANTTSFDGSL